MVSREELVFCADGGDGSYGWFWHEADVLLYALGREVAAKKKIAAEITLLHEAFRTDVIHPFLATWRQYIYRLSVTLLTTARALGEFGAVQDVVDAAADDRDDGCQYV